MVRVPRCARGDRIALLYNARIAMGERAAALRALQLFDAHIAHCANCRRGELETIA